MIYYRVKPEYDNLQRYNGRTVHFDGIWIGNELYTKKELDKLVRSGLFVSPKYFDVVNVSKNNIFWSFGARFECRNS